MLSSEPGAVVLSVRSNEWLRISRAADSKMLAARSAPASPDCIARFKASLALALAPMKTPQVSSCARAWLASSLAQPVRIRPAAAATAAILPMDLIDMKVPFRERRKNFYPVPYPSKPGQDVNAT